MNHIYQLEDEASNTLSVKKLEHMDNSEFEAPARSSRAIMRLEFGCENEKDVWKEAITRETDQLKSLALCL